MLYLVATPIGNISDITFRAIEILQECDLILCEDTRHSTHLLSHYDIHKPLISFHSFNEKKRENEIVELLKQGKKIALISDAGSPLISDPGESLVNRMREEGFRVSPIPGPSSVIAALSASGLPTTPFQFLGFIPRNASEQNLALLKIALFEGTSLFFESSERVINTLEKIAERGPLWNGAIARELTKIHEEFIQGKPQEIVENLKQKPPQGELVLMFHTGEDPLKTLLQDMSPKDFVSLLTHHFELSLKEAIKIAASLKGLPKQIVYKEFF